MWRNQQVATTHCNPDKVRRLFCQCTLQDSTQKSNIFTICLYRISSSQSSRISIKRKEGRQRHIGPQIPKLLKDKLLSSKMCTMMFFQLQGQSFVREQNGCSLSAIILYEIIHQKHNRTMLDLVNCQNNIRTMLATSDISDAGQRIFRY